MSKTILSLLTFTILSASLFAQDFKPKIIILSPEIGEKIDSTEKADNHLFPYFSTETFSEAQILQDKDSTYFISVTLKNSDIQTKIISKEEVQALLARFNPYGNPKINNSGGSPEAIKGLSPKNSFYIILGGEKSINLTTERVSYNSSRYQSLYGGYGNGQEFNFGFGIKHSDFLSFELRGNYFTSDVHLVAGHSDFTMFRVTPVIKLGFVYKLIEPYFKFGPTFGLSSRINYNSVAFTDVDQYNQTHDINEDYHEEGGFSVGLTTAIGVTFPARSRFSYYIEINSVTLSHAPTTQTITRYDVDGRPQISNLTNTQFNFTDSPDRTDNKSVFKKYYELNNIGLNIGAVFYF